jgi:hypothetical protein
MRTGGSILKTKLKVLDLFSGIGGFSLGLHSTDIFDTVKFVEFDEFCQKILKKNFPNVPIEGDIKNVRGKEFEADIIVGDSPANHSVSQVNKKEEMTTDISGQKCLDSLKKSNPSSLLERMCKELLTSKTAWSSDRCKMTWKVKVSKSNVSLYQLQASVLGINDSESGLWLTPSTMDISQRSPDAMKKRIEMRKKTGRTSIPPGSLSEQVQTGRPTKDMREVMDMETMKMYPTPRTGGGSRPNGKGGKVLEEEVMIEYGLRERGKTLKQMYPTPRASGQEDAETLIKRKGEKAAAQHNLTAQCKCFPT